MKLYIYDHCPFCARARMMAGFLGMSLEEVTLLNDDEATPNALIGAKQVPILQKEDGTAMGESLDIVRYLAQQAAYDFDENVRDGVQKWFDKVGKYQNHLVQPRAVYLPLAEFASESARLYYTEKKEEKLGKFSDNMAQTKKYLSKINRDLKELEMFLLSDQSVSGKEGISMEDILLFPILRNLTMVRGIVFPERIAAYIQNMATKSKMDTYLNFAI